MNQEILNSIKRRNLYHSRKDIINYRVWRNKVKSLIFSSKREYFNSAINSNVSNPKKLWAGMNALTGLKSNSATSHILDKEGEIINDPFRVANEFNNHFCSIHKKLTGAIDPNSDIHFSRLKSMTHDKLQNKYFSIPFITCEFVYNHIAHLDISKSTGSENIS